MGDIRADDFFSGKGEKMHQGDGEQRSAADGGQADKKAEECADGNQDETFLGERFLLPRIELRLAAVQQAFEQHGDRYENQGKAQYLFKNLIGGSDVQMNPVHHMDSCDSAGDASQREVHHDGKMDGFLSPMLPCAKDFCDGVVHQVCAYGDGRLDA